MFHFKKFSIDDSAAAMKIGTDAVLLGAWTRCENETRILDIGTGCGILSIMLAQRTSMTLIDALEIDPAAAALAKENANISPWKERICIHETSFQDFSQATLNKYSLIVCNPPFFSNSLKANTETRNLARHNDHLPLNDLFSGVANLLADTGTASFIFPFDGLEKWKTEAEKYSLIPVRIILVKSSPTHSPHRAMVTFTKEKTTEVVENEICIYLEKGIYSNEYQNLTSAFYLKF
ncbi:MAG: tRNA1(Val) (adenine(37)-N6)-methyltransferase [Bacteroidales bacterium]